MGGLFVAIGDSFTEGVGDWDTRHPNGVRGWADRVAKQLSKADPDTRYANLAIRSRRLAGVVEGQIEPALAMDPDLVSFYAGGNDLLEVRKDLGPVLATYTRAVERLATSGARCCSSLGSTSRCTPSWNPSSAGTGRSTITCAPSPADIRSP